MLFLEKYQQYLQYFSLLTEATKSELQCARFLITCKQTRELIEQAIPQLKPLSFSNITCYSFVSDEKRKICMKNKTKVFQDCKQHCNVNVYLFEHAVYGYISKTQEDTIQHIINYKDNKKLFELRVGFDGYTLITPVNKSTISKRFYSFEIEQSDLDNIKNEINNLIDMWNNKIINDISNFIKTKKYGFNLYTDDRYKCIDKEYNVYIGLDTHKTSDNTYNIHIGNLYPADRKLPDSSKEYQLVTFN